MWFIEDLKKKVKEAEEHEQIAMIGKAMTDRRLRDLSDIVSEQEAIVGWQQVVHFLTEAMSFTYSPSFDMSSRRSALEPLKYREILFDLLTCTGLESVELSTDSILKMVSEEESLIDASQSVLQQLLAKARNQIESGDIFFFDIDSPESVIPEDMVDLIRAVMKHQSDDVRIQQRDSLLDVSSLWHTRGGYQALSQLGIQGNLISRNTLDIVLSVIQPTVSYPSSIIDDPDAHIAPSQLPSMKQYRELLQHIIDQDIDGLESLGSKHAVSTLTAMLNEAVSNYEESQSSGDYRYLLRIIRAHLRVRSLESILPLEKLCHLSEPRIVNPVVVALASFYHESAVDVLGRHLCISRNPELIETISNAIVNISKRCPEAKLVLHELESTNCERPNRIKKILRRIENRKYKYYL